jgi:hypothetical protein
LNANNSMGKNYKKSCTIKKQYVATELVYVTGCQSMEVAKVKNNVILWHTTKVRIIRLLSRVSRRVYQPLDIVTRLSVSPKILHYKLGTLSTLTHLK